MAASAPPPTSPASRSSTGSGWDCRRGRCRWREQRRARDGRVEIRIEAFNLLNRNNFGAPALIAFAGSPTAASEPVLSTFGRITTTVTSARQLQLGVKVYF